MADTADNRQFSVMVDRGGVLSYPQNFITANSLAKFGSDVVGTLNSLVLTNTDYDSKNTLVVAGSTKFSPMIDGGFNIIEIDASSCYTNSIIKIANTHAPAIEINNNDCGILLADNISIVYEDNPLIQISNSSVYDGISFVNTNFNNSNIISISSSTNFSSIINVNTENNTALDVPIIKVNGEDYLAQFAKKTDVQSKLSYYSEELYGDGSTRVSINAEDVTIGQSNTTIRVTPYYGIEAITIDSTNGVNGSAIATTIGTSEDSSKLPTEGAIVKALKNVSGGSAPSNMVTTDTEQTIEGNKTFTGEIGISGIIGKRNTGISISTFRDAGSENETFVSTPGTTILRAGHDVAEIPAELSIVYNYNDNSSKMSLTARNITIGSPEYNTEDLDKLNIYSGGTTTYEYYRINKFIDGYNFMYDNDMVLSLDGEKATFEIPQRLRVYDTVTKKWTNTYKYTYLAQDANGNVTLAISDTTPLEGGHHGGSEN